MQVFIIVIISIQVIFSYLQVDSVVAAEYELEYLLLEGHCFDVTTGQPPRGLQFTLGTASDPVILDTIVMANLVSGRHRFIWEIIPDCLRGHGRLRWSIFYRVISN